MAQSLRTRCPHCRAGLKLKDRSAVGTKKRCPNCGEGFVVKPVRSSERAQKRVDDEEVDEQPAATSSSRGSSSRRAPAGRKGAKSKSSRPSPLIWSLIGGGALIVVLVVAVSLMRSRGGNEKPVAETADQAAPATTASNEPKRETPKSPTTTPAAPPVVAATDKPATPNLPNETKSLSTPPPSDAKPEPDTATTKNEPTPKQAETPAPTDASPAAPAEPNANAAAADQAESNETVDVDPDGRGKRGSGASSNPPPESIPQPSAAEKPLITEAPRTVKIDGKFDDWKGVTSYTDPPNDTHDVDHHEYDKPPVLVDHPDSDLLEYKVAHDADNLYFYFRSRGRIGRTQREAKGKKLGRFYIIVTIDVDQNDETGYWIHEGGYWPTSRGYDVNAEVEYYGGEFNTGHYLNHGCKTEAELEQALLDQSSGGYTKGKNGPYKPGFMRFAPGTYEHYTQWVYHKNGNITLVRDKGPVVKGIVSSALSDDAHEIEFFAPYKGFLVDPDGKPVIGIGKVLDLSFSLECSGELVKDKLWTSDTGEPIERYKLTSNTDVAKKGK